MEGHGYSSFAAVYDRLMGVGLGEGDYAVRGEKLHSLIEKHGGKKGILLDLACGTGNMSEIMAKKGYDVIGTDISEEMLTAAMDKKAESGLPIQYLRQDMRQLDMFGTIDVTLCLLDSINHLGSLSDIEKTFGRVSLFSEPKGLFIFDMNTPFKHREVLGNNTFVYDLEDIYCVWQNFFEDNSEDCRVDIALDFFAADEKGMYRRFSDELCETAYESGVIAKLLEKSGFEILEISDGDSFESPNEKSERLLYVCRKVRIV